MSKSLKLIIEALLFSSDKPLTVKDIKDVLPDTDSKDIKSALAILEHDFAAIERSFMLNEVAGGYQLRSRPEYGSYILRMLQSTPNRLSRAAMETLAIVAYKQPILKHEIEKLRGVDVGGILKTLMEKDLVKIMGRKDLPGKPLIYGTTKRFLEVFDLKDISELPKMNEIKDFGLTAYEPTPLNQDHPLEPQGTEGLRRSPDQAAETSSGTTEEDLMQDGAIASDESAENPPETDQDAVTDENNDDMNGGFSGNNLTENGNEDDSTD
jgi:segregation and condensation protein B